MVNIFKPFVTIKLQSLTFLTLNFQFLLDMLNKCVKYISSTRLSTVGLIRRSCSDIAEKPADVNRDDGSVVINPLNIQLLSNSLHKQVFHNAPR